MAAYPTVLAALDWTALRRSIHALSPVACPGDVSVRGQGAASNGRPWRDHRLLGNHVVMAGSRSAARPPAAPDLMAPYAPDSAFA
jgi:hypothetical protein